MGVWKGIFENGPVAWALGRGFDRYLARNSLRSRKNLSLWLLEQGGKEGKAHPEDTKNTAEVARNCIGGG